MEILYGLHPVEEALRASSRKFDHVCVSRERRDERLQRVIDLCRDGGVRLRFEPREHLTQLARNAGHQGVVAVVRAKAILDLEDLLAPLPARDGVTPNRLLLALDGVEDPQNLGALLRTADGAGVDGVVLTERRAAPLSGVAIKASAGAAEHVRVARVINMTRSLEQLKQRGIWCVGLDERGTMNYDEFDYTANCVLVLGREGAGLHDLVRKTCDQLLRIPMAGAVSSLNVSVAGAVVLYEAARQRRVAAGAAQLTAPSAAAMALPTPKPRKQKGLGSSVACGSDFPQPSSSTGIEADWDDFAIAGEDLTSTGPAMQAEAGARQSPLQARSQLNSPRKVQSNSQTKIRRQTEPKRQESKK